MKHNLKITTILVIMFFITQLIGLFIFSNYSSGVTLPYGMEPPEEITPESSVISIIFSFILAIGLFFILTKLKAENFIRIWFFAVTVLAISLSLNIILFKFNVLYSSMIALLISFPLAFFKIFKRNLIVHNLTELIVYPGIASVLIPLINVPGIIFFLLLISLYDIWAVWHTAFMQKMAKYQIDTIQIFTGFFIPYAGKKEKKLIREIKDKYKNKSEKLMEKELSKSKIKVSLAILGGGDIIFPIITAGVFYNAYHSLIPAFIIVITSTLALLSLFILARKGKFYPAMPFLSIGIYIGMIINWVLMYLRFY
ncbi:MAG: presenilin family intramembrane aspartyl protease [Candidatus Pacearchaeota archaeon]|jgi:presenilin-like A22 family membrane protease